VNVKVNVKRKFIVNGKEYGSVEEMPGNIREAYEKTVVNKAGLENGNIPSITSGKIVFNGQEYASVDLMPADVHQMYETIMKTVKEEKFSVTGNVDFHIGKKATDFKNEGMSGSSSASKPISPESFVSSRMLIIAAAILALLAGLYFLFSIDGPR
jgi:hypothetical protein